MRHYATLAQFGGGAIGTEPITLMLGLSVRGGAVFGDPGGFFISQKFSLGGVQYGEPLRGYRRSSRSRRRASSRDVTDGPRQAQFDSFGSAFYTSSVELGLRINQQIYLDAFYDAGNIWARPQDFNPTRLFRGAGFGGSIVTPLGPLGTRLGVRLRSYHEWRDRIPSGNCTSSSVSSSNLEFYAFRSSARHLSRLSSSPP